MVDADATRMVKVPSEFFRTLDKVVSKVKQEEASSDAPSVLDREAEAFDLFLDHLDFVIFDGLSQIVVRDVTGLKEGIDVS